MPQAEKSFMAEAIRRDSVFVFGKGCKSLSSPASVSRERIYIANATQVGQGAVDFAALTAHAAIRIHDEQTLRESPYANLILGYRLFRDAHRTEHRGGQRQTSQTLAGELQELPTSVVLVKEALLISHVVSSF